ncbi:MAG: acetate kinase [Spirochaetales bacterium]|nr:acetate kinase [Spirochaetales bacterium]
MIILVINSGSSSLKFQLRDVERPDPLCRGLIERIGLPEGRFLYEPSDGPRQEWAEAFPDHRVALERLLGAITSPDTGVIPSVDVISAVGHRIVHGGEKIFQSMVITPEVESLVEEAGRLAPLHNPAHLLGIRAVRSLLPSIPQVGVFDTAFHATMPEEAFVYALPYEFYQRHGIRRFGFHGTSHQYVALRAAELLGKPHGELNCITCHLGNGVSITAVRGGRSVDTSLGFGTVCGVPMGTRSGDVDPAVILYMIDQLGIPSAEVSRLLYHESGLRGLSGVTSDMRDVAEAAREGSRQAELALRVFTRSARKYIAALATCLADRLDALVFTAGIGEHSPVVRERICQGLGILGVAIDPQKNQSARGEVDISAPGSRTAVLVIPTDEEKMIALETQKLLAALRTPAPV